METLFVLYYRYADEISVCDYCTEALVPYKAHDQKWQ